VEAGHHRHAGGRGRRAMTAQARAARIVLVTAQTTGGIGRHVSSLLPELLNRGARVEVAAPRATGGLGAEAAGTPFWPVEIPRLPSPVPAVSALRDLKRGLDGADLVDAPGLRAAAARAQLGLEPGLPLVVSVGRLEPQKGFDILVEATARMNGSSPPVVVICGEGPARKDLEDRIRALGLGERVRLLGNRNDAKAFIAAADAFCMPSRWEGSPLALHEALAAGRPVVASAVGGIPELLTFGQAGLLVPPEDPGALASAVGRVLSDRGLAEHLGAQALEAAEAWPDAAITARKVADLYE